MRVLVGSPVRQKPIILKEFLRGLTDMDGGDLDINYFFIDDNVASDSTSMLLEFSKNNKTIIKDGKDIIGDLCVDKSYNNYLAIDEGHYWKVEAIQKITIFKNAIIDYCLEKNFDFLFFVDSDIVVDRRCLLHLVDCNKDIISEVFWTQWRAGEQLLPQIFDINISDSFLPNDSERTSMMSQFRIPGVYEVSGLGACTLISKEALLKGVSFKKIEAISTFGEDRDFCIRASALGFKLYVDTHFPCYHIYREHYLSRVEEFKRCGFKFDMCQGVLANKKKHNLVKNILSSSAKTFKKIGKKMYNHHLINSYYRKRVTNNKNVVCSMIVRNEEKRYLQKTIDSVKDFVDFFVIVDDCSTDGTIEEIETILISKPHIIIKNRKQSFQKEYKLRKQLFKETIKHNPGWILALDADEVYEKKSINIIKILLEIDCVDEYRFRLYDMWDDTHYRSDRLWNIHNRFFPALLRYVPHYKYKWKKAKQHCGRLPNNIGFIVSQNIDLKVQHFGWARKSDRIAKYKRYMALDKQGKYGNLEQYKSIMDENPNLIEFTHNE